MNTDVPVQISYREEVLKQIRSNLLSFSVGTALFFTAIGLIGYGVRDQISLVAQNQWETIQDYAQSFTPVAAPTETLLIENSFKDPTVNFISPGLSKYTETRTPQISPFVDNGQISAIQTGPVTYKLNKYIVKEGDSLASIAQEAYGDRNAWVTIAKANNLASPDLIEAGMELVIPR